MVYNLSGYCNSFEYVLDAVSFIYLIAVPIISMRALAEEKRQKTDQLLYALPLRPSDVVVGKYLGMVPVLMLTAKGELEDRVLGLNAGADDYLSKPFAASELVARVSALSRRSDSYAQREQGLTVGNITLDCGCYLLGNGAEQLRLNNKEFQLMELFMRHPRFVFSASQLMDRVWTQDSDAELDVVWTYIGFLRKKLRQLNADVEIKTIRGAGYSLEELSC